MGRIMFKRALRDLKTDLPRLLALSILIFFSIFIVVSLMGAAITVIDYTEIRDRELIREDGEFTVFVPLTDEELDDLNSRGVTVEEMFFTDYELNESQVLRVFKVRNHINQMSVVERRFAEVNGYEVGDDLVLAGKTLSISGIGATPDYNCVYRNVSDNVVSSESFGTVFVMPDKYEQMLVSGLAIASEEYSYVYLLNGAMTDDELRDILEENEFDLRDVNDEYFVEYWERLTGRRDDLLEGIDELCDGADELHDGITEYSDAVLPLQDLMPELIDSVNELDEGASELSDGAAELADGVHEFSDETNDLIDEVFDIKTQNLRTFLEASENPRIDAASDDVVVNLYASIIFGILLVVLFAYVISVFVVHTIDSESAVIGALYSMGIKSRTLTLSYVAVPVLVCLISGVIGTAAAVLTPLGIPAQMADTMNYFSMPVLEAEVTPLLLMYGLVIPPVMALIVNVFVIRKRLMRTPLSLLKNERKIVQGKNLKIKGLKFIDMFRLRQFLREMRSSLTVVFGLFMCLLIATLALNVYVYCGKAKTDFVKYTNYEYMYTYKYPTE
ncbi:MAG: hypothetical protein K6A37_04745 [Saccharofermentans sp.]|nr:hypothetical protein [Saccharofermentans sp.]